MSGRIAVGVSGQGSNLRALAAAETRGTLGGEIVLVFADRPCEAIDWAAEQGIATIVIDGGDDAALAEALAPVSPDLVVLAGYMRIVGRRVLALMGDRIVNTHPSLLPAFPGRHAVRDALAAGVRVTGCTVHRVDATLDGGPILAQEAVAVLATDDEATLHDRIKRMEHRLLPWTVCGLLGPRTRPRRALLSVSDKTGLTDLATGLDRLGFELVSTGGTARALRGAGLSVTDVADVTGFPEMLDGRVKTLHPRIHGGILARADDPAHRQALEAAAIEPFELVVVNLYPFAKAVETPGITFDALVEEIDIGGPSLIRAAAKNHASVAVVTSVDRYDAVLAALAEPTGVPQGLRAALAVEAFRHTAAYDARIAQDLPCFMDEAGIDLPDDPGLPRSPDPYPPSLTIALEKVETLRYGENPHQTAARYRRPGARSTDGPFATGEPPLQGKALSYNNVLDAAAAAALARALRGPACVIVKHTNPCGAAERTTLLEAWQDALAGDPVSAFGGVVGLTREVNGDVARAMTELFLEVVVAPGFDDEAREILAAKPNLRLVQDPTLATDDDPPWPNRLGAIRSAGGAILVSTPDTRPDAAADWAQVTGRAPTDEELLDLDLAWRLCRGVTSNAIVLVRDRRLIGVGSGQTSRVDAARQAVEKARGIAGDAAVRGSACASDAFFPFRDAVDACLEAGVTAFVQPGGSMRDAEVIGAVEAAGGVMLVTGTRHFRH